MVQQSHTSLQDMRGGKAMQLRDQYDYLILAYSGGADSDNILKVFQQNKIHLDEVWCDWPLSLVEKSNYVVKAEPIKEPVDSNFNSEKGNDIKSRRHQSVEPGSRSCPTHV
jgi:hypothetical protein